MKANSDKSTQSNKATRRVLAGVLCGASVLSLVLSLVMPPISQAIANDGQTDSTEETVMGGGSSSESTDVDNTTNGDTKNQNSDETEGDASEGTVAADSTADGAEVKGAEQPSDAQLSDNENSDENAIAPVSAEDYQDVQGDVASKFNGGGKYRLSGESWSDSQITITANTTIDLNGNMLYHRPGSVESFIVVQNNATLTIEDSGRVVDDSKPFTGEPGQPATMTWTGNNNGTPQSLTYYETTSTPNDNFGTTETTTMHVVSGFGAIVAASDSGSVKRVVSVEAGGTLNLNGGMVTTPRPLVGNDGHVIFSQGTVNISGGYVTNGSGGGWGGGLCVTGTNAKLEMTNGVIAANKAASGGGIYADNGAKLKFLGGVISGNATYKECYNDVDNPNNGYGGGVFTKNADVEIVDPANITNNRVESYITEKFNLGLLGGGGIASVDGGTLNMTGGSVTANYSQEAGGGIYAGFWGKAITFTMTGGTIAGNESVNGEGGGLRIAGGNNSGTMATINAGENSKIYITNNKTMTGSTKDRGGDWGGGGIFIQEHGRLNVLRSLITGNKAGGWSGGIGACPTGETIVSHSYGAAIYGNKDNVDQNGNPLGRYHYSAGGNNKNQDHDETNYVTPDFQKSGHKDFFLVRNKNDADKTIAVVLGKMLGGGSAGWHGTCDGNPVTIDPNGGAEAKWMFGLEAHPNGEAVKKAQAEATTIISGNYSYTHGGGIMTNGDLIVGEVTSLDVYPAIKVKANKVLMKDGAKQSLKEHSYQFKLLGAPANSEKAPCWNENGTLNENGCDAMPAVNVDENGDILIGTGANYQSGDYDLYLVEVPPDPDNVPVNEKGTKFDKSIYKIHIKVGTEPVKWTDLLGIHINRYAVDGDASTVSVKKEDAADFAACDDDFYEWSWAEDSHGDVVSTVKLGKSNSAFTNRQASGSWTPQVTKKVDGGEMKAFTFELANEDDLNFTNPKTVTINPDPANAKTDKNGNATSTVNFKPKNYELTDLKNGSMTFTYYVREKNEHSTYPHYKFDQSVYKFTVVATDCTKEGKIKCEVTYKQIQDRDGKLVTTDTPHDLTKSTPTFTNTYSTSLPLSGMSGVTLTYLAGAAVLCAAAAWMHIRRKANAKGGERRE
mgnify:CR=1 FL=1